MAGFWKKVLAAARLGAIVAGRVPVKGTTIGAIAEEAEKDGEVIAGSVRKLKAVPKKTKPRSGTTGD